MKEKSKTTITHDSEASNTKSSTQQENHPTWTILVSQSTIKCTSPHASFGAELSVDTVLCLVNLNLPPNEAGVSVGSDGASGMLLTSLSFSSFKLEFEARAPRFRNQENERFSTGDVFGGLIDGVVVGIETV